LVVIPLVYACAFVGSVLYGTPAELPGVALGLPLLLDLERAAAVLAAFALVSIFAILTSRGHLPTRFGNVGYPDIGRQHELEQRVAELNRRLNRRFGSLETRMRESDASLPVIVKALETIDSRLRLLEDRLDSLD
jgi:hypothetical protein